MSAPPVRARARVCRAMAAVACAVGLGVGLAACSGTAVPATTTTAAAIKFPLADLVPSFYAANYSFEGAKGLRVEPFATDAASYGVVTIDGGPVNGRGGLLVYKLKPDAGDPAQAFLQSAAFEYRGPLEIGGGRTGQVGQDKRTGQPIVCFTEKGFLYCATAASSFDTSGIIGALTGSS